MKTQRLLQLASIIMVMMLPGKTLQAGGDNNPNTVTAVPREMTYQAILRDSVGDPVADSVYSIKFRIFDVESGGSSLWEQTLPCTTTVGVFNVMFSDVNLPFDEDYWLELEIDSEILDPRRKMGMVGYAAVSDTADYALAVAAGAGSKWSVTDSVLYTDDYWGIGRGNAGNQLLGTNSFTMVNFGVACTTGMVTENNQFSTISGGRYNIAQRDFSTIGGGEGNTIYSHYGTIGGGKNNTTVHEYATVGGGENNWANWQHTTVGGGKDNVAGDWYSVVAGGLADTANGQYNAIAGGNENKSTGDYTAIGGGYGNVINGSFSTISGGAYNTADGAFSAVPGGNFNSAQGTYSLAAGRRAIANHYGTFVWGDATNADFASTAPNQFLIRASAGVGIGTNSPTEQLDVAGMVKMDGFKMGTGASNGYVLTTDSAGIGTWQAAAVGNSNWSVTDSVLYTDDYWGIGRGNAGNQLLGTNSFTMVNFGVACTTGMVTENNQFSTISGGRYNTAQRDFSTIGGGEGNTIYSHYGTIGGGKNNTTVHEYATVGGGENNRANWQHTTVGGGKDNLAGDWYSVVAGGLADTANGQYNAIAGGNENKSNGHYTAIGGGYGNVVNGSYSTISGGANNTAGGTFSAVPGGSLNSAQGTNSLAAGRRAKANNNGSFVWADETDADFTTTGDDQFLIRASGGVGIGTDNPTAALHVEGEAKSVVNGVEFYMVPKGAIIMWSGDLDSIPSGWALCDGINATPDLSDKFIYGVHAGENPGATGGSATIPAHNHNVDIAPFWSQQPNHAWLGASGGVSLVADYNHQHVVDPPNTTSTSNGSASNLPPYYKLAFIKKL